MFFSSAWWQMHTPHALRACVYEVCKPLVPLLLCIAALVAVILYALADNLHSFVSRIFIPQYHYPYAVPLAFIQVLCSHSYIFISSSLFLHLLYDLEHAYFKVALRKLRSDDFAGFLVIHFGSVQKVLQKGQF